MYIYIYICILCISLSLYVYIYIYIYIYIHIYIYIYATPQVAGQLHAGLHERCCVGLELRDYDLRLYYNITYYATV